MTPSMYGMSMIYGPYIKTSVSYLYKYRNPDLRFHFAHMGVFAVHVIQDFLTLLPVSHWLFDPILAIHLQSSGHATQDGPTLTVLQFPTKPPPPAWLEKN